jgi:hypothetical protein
VIADGINTVWVLIDNPIKYGRQSTIIDGSLCDVAQKPRQPAAEGDEH